MCNAVSSLFTLTLRGVAMDTLILERVGRRIRDLRKQAGLSQEQLGEIAGFHFSYIGGVERAEKNITLINLERIADALNVSIIELFEYTGYKKTGNDLFETITDKLTTLNKSELRKVRLFLDEFF